MINRAIIRGLLLVVLLGGWLRPVSAQESGEAIFNRVCKACHTVGLGKLVGPDLAGVTHRRSPDWLVKFILSSQSVIKSGDPEAVAVFKEFNSLVMPDNPFSAAEIQDVLRYIESQGGVQGSAAQSPTPLDTATPEDLVRGGQLFQGRFRLSGGGPACNSCHHVAKEGIMGGGRLARDLTGVASRVGAPGIQAILVSPPFPAMQQAYAGRELTADEAFALVAFLQDLERAPPPSGAIDHGVLMFVGGLVGTALLMTVYALIWMHRKQSLVYHEIHRRQIDSQ